MRAPTVQLHPECQGWASLALNGWFVTDVFCVSWFIVQLNRTFSFGSRGGVHFQLVDSGKVCGGEGGLHAPSAVWSQESNGGRCIVVLVTVSAFSVVPEFYNIINGKRNHFSGL